MVAKVAIDLSLDRLFDYEVPEELKKKLAVGQLLSVPFGHRFARGFVMEVDGDGGRDAGDVGAPPVQRPLKPITAIVDEKPRSSTRRRSSLPRSWGLSGRSPPTPLRR